MRLFLYLFGGVAAVAVIGYLVDRFLMNWIMKPN